MSHDLPEQLKPLQNLEFGPEFDGFDIFIVGGAVRDALRGLIPEDIDILVVARNDEIANPIEVLEERMHFIDPSSSAPVFHDSENREVALPRSEESNGMGFHDFDFHVVPADVPVKESVERDLKRRDLTVNAIAFDIRNNRLIDPFDGHIDLLDGVLRPVSGAFREDPLRVIRAARFAPRLDANLSPELVKMSRDIANQRVSKFNQLAVLAKDFDADDRHLAELLQEIAFDSKSEQEVIERVEAIRNPVMGGVNIAEALHDDMSQIEILPDERVLMELRKVVKQAKNPGRFFRVLDEVDALDGAFPVIADLSENGFDALVGQVNSVREAVGPSHDGFFAALGDVLGPSGVDAFIAAHSVNNHEKDVLKQGADDMVRRLADVPEMNADSLVALANRVFGNHGLDAEGAIEIAEGLVQFDEEGFDRDAVHSRLMHAGQVLDDVDGKFVMDREGLSPDDIGSVVSGQEFGDMIDAVRAEKLSQ